MAEQQGDEGKKTKDAATHLREYVVEGVRAELQKVNAALRMLPTPEARKKTFEAHTVWPVGTEFPIQMKSGFFFQLAYTISQTEGRALRFRNVQTGVVEDIEDGRTLFDRLAMIVHERTDLTQEEKTAIKDVVRYEHNLREERNSQNSLTPQDEEMLSKIARGAYPPSPPSK